MHCSQVLIFLGLAVRLVFMHEGSHKCETVVHFKDIQDVENYQHYNVIPPGVASLKITSRGKYIYD